MENLKALVYKGDLTPYQRALAQREFEGLIERLELYEKAVKNNVVLPHVSDTVCHCYNTECMHHRGNICMAAQFNCEDRQTGR